MIDLHKEAEKYADNTIGFSNENHAEWEFVQHHIIQFIQSSKYVQAEKLKAQIDVLKLIIENCHSKDTQVEVNIYVNKLKQQLTQLENENN